MNSSRLESLISTAANGGFVTSYPDYKEYRPNYPAALIDFLSEQVSTRDLAWDSGTGNGQAACMLGSHFSEVIATDSDPQQLERSILHPRVSYHVATAENATVVPSNSVDLVTAASALHWFDQKLFGAEVNRTLRNGGVLAFWAPGLLQCEALPKDILATTLLDRIRLYWPRGNNIESNEERYRAYQMPFAELSAPTFELNVQSTLPQLMGYLSSWSAVTAFRRATGNNPLQSLSDAISHIWGDPDCAFNVKFAIVLRAARK